MYCADHGSRSNSEYGFFPPLIKEVEALHWTGPMLKESCQIAERFTVSEVYFFHLPVRHDYQISHDLIATRKRLM
jgi:hypothetical protein